MADLIYDGTTLTWPKNGNKSYKATSGLPHGQLVQLQRYPDFGPVPNGLYSVNILDGRVAKMKNDEELAAGSGMQTTPKYDRQGKPIGWPEWGGTRMRLETIRIDDPNARSRGGFYLHDSEKGFSHGCIETQNSFFEDVKAYRDSKHVSSLTLQVKYAAGTTVTNGGTGTSNYGGKFWTPGEEKKYHEDYPGIKPENDPGNPNHR